MKYRLKKDLPDMEAGEVFDDTDGFGHETSSMFDSRGTYRFEKDDVKHFGEWFEEVSDEWPQKGEYCYRVSSRGTVICFAWRGDWYDKQCQEFGNVFKTEKSAKAYADYLKAVDTVRQDEGVLTPEQINELGGIEGKAYHVGYRGKQNGEEVLCGCLIDLYETWAPVGTILFDTEEHADASRKKHQDEWRIIANYDWSRE